MTTYLSKPEAKWHDAYGAICEALHRGEMPTAEQIAEEKRLAEAALYSKRTPEVILSETAPDLDPWNWQALVAGLAFVGALILVFALPVLLGAPK